MKDHGFTAIAPIDILDEDGYIALPVADGKKRTLVFFGGEPLLVPETVSSAISHVREGPAGDDTDIMLQTNGVAIDAETAEFLAANDVFIYLSLDGVADVHDRHREFLTGPVNIRSEPCARYEQRR